MGIGDQLGDIGLTEMLPSISGAGFMKMLTWVGGSILFAIVLCLVIVLGYFYLMYNQKVKLFKKIGNKIVEVATLKAKFERLGRAGDRQFYVRGVKKYLPTPTIQMAKNTWWYFEREDGEWINFSLADLDEIMKKAGAFYVDFDMRMSRLGIEKNLGERLMKQSFWDKYGATLMNLMAFMVLCIGLVIFFWQLNKVMISLSGLVNSMNGYVEAFNNIVQRSGGTQVIS